MGGAGRKYILGMSLSRSGPCGLLKSFVAYAKMNQAGKMMMNLAIASLDIANRLRAKCNDGDLEPFPDPTSFDDWGFEGQDQLSSEEVQFLHSLFELCSKTNSL